MCAALRLGVLRCVHFLVEHAFLPPNLEVQGGLDALEAVEVLDLDLGAEAAVFVLEVAARF